MGEVTRDLESMKRVSGEAACLVDNALVVADLHIGMEKELRNHGIALPPQEPQMVKRLLALLEKTQAGRVVVLGDLKHAIPRRSWEEYSQVPRLVKALEARAGVTLVKGNHDGGIEKLLPSTKVVSKLAIGGSLLVHGHRRAQSLEYSHIVLAHNHPAVEFVDELGGKVREKVWLELEFREEALKELGLDKSPRITVMPSFNELMEGYPFNLEEVNRGNGPLLREELVDITRAKVFLLDGTWLGRLGEVRQL